MLAGCSTHFTLQESFRELELAWHTVRYVHYLQLNNAMQVAFLQCGKSTKHQCFLHLCDAVAGSLIHV